MNPPMPRQFRVAILTAHDEERELRNLVRRVAAVPGVEIAGVLRSQATARPLVRIRNYWRRHGTPAFVFNLAYQAVLVAASVGRRLTDRLLGSLRPLRSQPTLEQSLRQLNAGEVRVASFRGLAAVDALRALDADLGVVWGTPILGPELFSIPRLGCINIHLAALPRYRGAGPVGLWEVIDGQREVGVSVHRVDSGLDTGEVLGADTIAIEPFDTLRSLRVKATLAAHRVCANVIAGMARSGEQPCSPSAVARPDRFPLRRSLDRLTLERWTRRFRRQYGPPRRNRWEGARAAAAALFLFVAWIRRGGGRPRGPLPALVLTYHLIADRDHYLGLSTDEFIDHLEYLTGHYRIASLDEVVSTVRTGAAEEPIAGITFDDGYAENAGWGRELCELYDVPFTVFVCADLVDGRIPLPRPQSNATPSMDVAELRALADEDVEIGSHTCSHADCGDPSNWPEIPASRRKLEAVLGRPVRFFSFPYGEPHNCPAAARPIVAAAGYDAAFTAFGGANFVGDDLLTLKRVLVPRIGGRVRLEAAIQGWMPGRWLAARRQVTAARPGAAGTDR